MIDCNSADGLNFRLRVPLEAEVDEALENMTLEELIDLCEFFVDLISGNV